MFTTDGEIVKGDGKLGIKDASYLVFALSAGTNYKNEYPNYRGELPEGKVNSAIEGFLKKGYDEVKKEAIAEYKSLFDRFSFEVTSFTSTEYTDKLLSSYRENPDSKDVRYLEELLCQYGNTCLFQVLPKTMSCPPIFRAYGTIPIRLRGAVIII